jgi:hypothetical protein
MKGAIRRPTLDCRLPRFEGRIAIEKISYGGLTPPDLRRPCQQQQERQAQHDDDQPHRLDELLHFLHFGFEPQGKQKHMRRILPPVGDEPVTRGFVEWFGQWHLLGYVWARC